MVARFVRDEEAVGSNPATPTTATPTNASPNPVCGDGQASSHVTAFERRTSACGPTLAVAYPQCAPMHSTEETPSMPDERVAASGAPVTDQLLGGRYRLRERIGRGGMADVFAADDELLHRAVAVKVFRVDAGASSDQRRIDAEVHTLAALRHPGLVMIFDAGSAPEPHGQAAPFLVMELISGPALSQRLTSGPMTPEESALLGADLAATLAYVHAQGVVHRDVKPANVLLDIPAVAGLPFAAKLTDFGISRLVDSTRLTMHGMTIGTANYLSPEQVSSSDVGPPQRYLLAGAGVDRMPHRQAGLSGPRC